jgi:hypothetical protein
MQYKDFQSALEFLVDYGFEYCFDSATGRRKCYKNKFGEIVLDYKQLDSNYWIPQICIEINYWKQVLDVEGEYLLRGKSRRTTYDMLRRKTLFDKLHDIAKNDIAANGKVFGIIIEPTYLSNSNLSNS